MTDGRREQWPPMIEPGRWLRAAPAAAPAVPVRIGDAERDDAVSALGDHFAAGRLTREELDERIDRAMVARVDSDLAPLFRDLPRPVAPSALKPGRPVTGPSPVVLLAPVLLIALVVAAMLFQAPWLIWSFLWIFMVTGFWGRRRFRPYGPGPGHHPR